MQFEEEREEGPKALPLEIDRCSDLQFANTWFYRVISCFVPFPQAIKAGNSRDIRFRNVHCYSNSRVSFDSTILETTADVEVRDTEFAVLDITGGPLPAQPPAGATVLAAGAKVEKLADGFLNIAGAAVDSQGNVYFADAHEGHIYRWSQETRRAELVRDIPQQPVQLAFDKAGNLLVVAYAGNGTVLAFRPDKNDSEIVTLSAQPAAPRPGMTAVLPVNRWMHDAEFLRDSTMHKPIHYVSPDGTTFIPAGQDFTTGAMQWGIKMADVVRAFRLAPAVAGRPFYVTNEIELKTWAFTVGPDGTLSDPKLFVQEGGECVTTDDQGNVYLAAGQIMVFDPSGKRIDTIEVPQRPTSLVFGGPDRKTLFITARSSLYSAEIGTAHSPTMSATTTEKEILIQAAGPVNYQAVVDRQKGGDIKQLCLPATSQPVVDDLNNLFFLGRHGEDYTLRGWTGRDTCILSSAAEVVSQKSDEIVVQVKVEAAGTFKIVSTNPAVKASLAGKLRSYQEKTVEIKRSYSFQPDGIDITDEVLWVHPGLNFDKIEWTASFLPGCIQSPARLLKGAVKAGFDPVGSGGDKLPVGITYPFTAENILKNGWKVSLLTTSTSFDLQKSGAFFYERPWQTDWNQTAGFGYEIAGQPQGQPTLVKTRVSFAQVNPAEMPPVITLLSPGPKARWMDEKGEVPQYKVGDTVKLQAAAVNADGSPVADQDLSWDIRIAAWWKQKPFVLHGAAGTYTIPHAANEEEKAEAQKRQLLAVLKVTAQGRNGTESTEHFALLVGP